MRPATGPTVAPKSFDPLIHLDTNHTIKGYFPNDYFCLASKLMEARAMVRRTTSKKSFFKVILSLCLEYRLR